MRSYAPASHKEVTAVPTVEGKWIVHVHNVHQRALLRTVIIEVRGALLGHV